ncbi:MAG: photosynthetic reaction center cytochrome c subunit family protein, partial [Bryobacteraceae bacterium]
MKIRLQTTVIALGLMGLSYLVSRVLVKPAAAQGSGTGASEQKSGEFFKNVTTSTLKELTPSDFLGAMGVMTAALGYDCSDCHPGAGTDQMNWMTDSNPRKRTARRMVEMVAAINRQHFGGAQEVTCWTCHHGQDAPATSIALDKLYGAPNDEKGDIVEAAEGVP